AVPGSTNTGIRMARFPSLISTTSRATLPEPFWSAAPDSGMPSFSAERMPTYATLSHVTLVIGFGSSCSQPLFAYRPSRIVGSGRKTTSQPLEAGGGGARTVFGAAAGAAAGGAPAAPSACGRREDSESASAGAAAAGGGAPAALNNVDVLLMNPSCSD